MTPAPEEVFTIAPPPCLSVSGTSYFMQRKTPRRSFRALADYSKFDYADLEVEVGGRAQKVESGYAFTALVTRPTLTIASEDDRVRAARLLEKTQELCLVARALAVPHSLEPRIQVGNVVHS